ncbi:hypothetical protein [Chryseobacterium sp. JUb7]|uniref:hypothetical protein n=1 Tax=Chryseobacterium sp. JUb7 TaxID=2940599 RepID=UPI0021682000|nr:hypothetical protein [Chryseobacterium sp. JUb7]MCS3530131.1 TM2 domain-containing membrane protein YozV [Chryseobacterium sp. JUb7]
MADFIFLIFIPPVLLFVYYVGFVTMTKVKIKQVDNDMKTHVLRILFGLITFSVIALFILLIKWIITSSAALNP